MKMQVKRQKKEKERLIIKDNKCVAVFNVKVEYCLRPFFKAKTDQDLRG